MQSVVKMALLLALVGLIAILAWIGVMGVMEGSRGREIVLALALLPAAALFARLARHRLGGALAVIAALVSAFVGVALSFCLCPAPISTESAIILVAAAIVGAFAVIDLVIGLASRGARRGAPSA